MHQDPLVLEIALGRQPPAPEREATISGSRLAKGESPLTLTVGKCRDGQDRDLSNTSDPPDADAADP
jgi:hypothetical protein